MSRRKGSAVTIKETAAVCDEEAIHSDAKAAELENAENQIQDNQKSETKTSPDANAEIHVEDDGAVNVSAENEIPARKPYHERYYLLYGGDKLPEGLDIPGTEKFLKAFGYGDSSLKQARAGRNTAEFIERTFRPNRPGSRYCDFCGNELVGTEYEVLRDGRERCIACSRSAVRTEKEFKAIYRKITQNMESFYGVRITVPVDINMVNARKLHAKIGKSFVPTGAMDPRTLGVAIHDKEGYHIYLENGSPRLMAMMTMVHELTHIWQYLNWNQAKIKSLYGENQVLQVYEGMAKWSEIQYAYLVGEVSTGKREEIITRMRQDEYGYGFLKYCSVYPLSIETRLKGATPFDDPNKPL